MRPLPSTTRWVAATLAVGTALWLAAPATGSQHAAVTEQGSDTGPAAPADFSYVQKTLPGQPLPAHAYEHAAAEAAALPSTDGAWQSIGPTNIGGRVTGIALDPTQSGALYAGAASGGLWRSTDLGRTFQAAWPPTSTQAMGAVATGSDGTVYVGTGEPNPGGGSITYEGTGMYRSADHGVSWQHIGLANSGTTGAIAVDPRDPRSLLVAANGSLYSPGGDRGVYLSRDAGTSWTRVLDVANEFTGAVDVQRDPTDPQRVYAVLWDHRRTPTARTYGGVGSGVYRSTDGGATWQRLGGGLPGGTADVGRIGIGIAASEPGRIYAIVTATNGHNAGLYTSADAGTSWTALPDAPVVRANQSSYGWWFGKFWVDPHNAKQLHVAGVQLTNSTDGGRSWTATPDTAVHDDQHVMVWDPRTAGRVYLGNDGGVFRSESNASTDSWAKAEYEPFTQLYDVAISPQDASRVSGGAQDNGSIRSWDGVRFNQYYDGDGEQNLINPKNKDNVLACYQYGNCARSTDGGATMTDFSTATTANRRNWFTPVQFDPTDPLVLYYGGNVLNRSADGGVTWSVISPDLTSGPGKDNYPYGTITTIAAAPSDPRTIWVGTDDGHVWVTRDLGAHWTNVLSGQPWVTRVRVDPRNPGSAYVTLSGYRSGSAKPHLLHTSDSGRSWTDLSGDLPQAPVNDVVLGAGKTLYAATDQGVFVRNGNDRKWQRLGSRLPLVPVSNLAYDADHQRLVASTFGRGFYEIPTK